MELPGKIINGPRVYLRTLTVADANETYCGWLNDPEVTRHLDTKRATIPELRDYISDKIARPDALFFGIFVHNGDRFIGTIKLDAIDLVGGRATAAIMVGDKAYWGTGFGTEAMRLMTDYAFRVLQLTKIYLSLLAANAGAMRSYAKLGFREVPLSDRPALFAYNPHLQSDIVMVLERST